MKKLTLFYLESCPYCQKAIGYLDKHHNDPKYQEIEIERIEEKQNAELADQYDYYYVPTFFMGQEKLFEGAMEEADVIRVLDRALQ